MDTNILLGFLGVLVTIAGWFVAYYLTKQREMYQRRQELRVKYLERQIEEFYGPLFNLVVQIFVCEELQSALMEEDISLDDRHLPIELQTKGRDFLYHDYFKPLHDEMRLILKTKLFLAEGADIPESFYNYLRHSTQERIQKAMGELGINTSYIKGQPWPEKFYDDIKAGLDHVMTQYEQAMQGMKNQRKSMSADK